MTPEKVRSLRAEYAAGGISTVTLGARYGIDPSTVRDIVLRGRYWKHVV